MTRRRALILLPILAPIFLLGWIMNVVGERQRSSKNPPLKKAKPPAATTQEGIEIMVIPEIPEEIMNRK
jgi:hypothetical protein